MKGERERERPRMPKRFTRPEVLRGLQTSFAGFQAAENKETARRELVERMRAVAASYFSETDELGAVQEAIDEMDDLLRAEDPAMPQRIADRLAGAFEHIYRDPARGEAFDARLRDLERAERHQLIEEARAVPLSPEWMLYGNFGDDGRTFYLHVAGAHTLGLSEKLRELNMGLTELARRLGHDSAYANVERVEGVSWIVGEHPELMRRLGFHLAETDLTEEEKNTSHFRGETRRVRRSWMTRDELIARYGEKTS